jgi:membrane-associated phospholipid phosphatase
MGSSWALRLLLVLGMTHDGSARADAVARAPDPPSGHATTACDTCSTGKRLLTRGDLWFGLGAVACVAVTVPQDQWLTDETSESTSAGEHHLSRFVQPLGNVGLVLPTTLVVYGIARWTDHDALAGAAARVGASVIVAGTATLVLKETVGRLRPHDSPNDADELRPFSGNASFPSGHSAVVFAAATSLAAERPTPAVYALAYGTASLVAWSRVHDREHWASDVVGGALLGVWSARTVERAARAREGGRRRRGASALSLSPSRVSIAWRF